MANLPAKLDGARAKIQAAFTRAGVHYPTILYRTKAVVGANPAQGIQGTAANTDTTLTGISYRVASLAMVAHSGGLLAEGDVVLETVSLTVTEAMLQAAREVTAACFVVDGVEFRVRAYKPEPTEAPLYWTVTLTKAS